VATLEELRTLEEGLRRQNEELEASQEMSEPDRGRFLELLELGPVGCIVTDTAGLIVRANRAAESLLRCEPGSLSGRPLALLFRERQMRHINGQMALATMERAIRTCDAWINGRGCSKPTPVSVTLVPLARSRAAAVWGFRFVVNDLGEMIKKKRRCQELEEAIGQRIAERTAGLAEEVERLRLTVARYADQYGALPAQEHGFPEPNDDLTDETGASAPSEYGERSTAGGVREPLGH
jgi:transcriptional regulator with PAS, ATPase and Fis domain